MADKRDAVLVRVSPEILAMLAAGTVEPVVVLGIEQREDGTHDMILRSVNQDLTRLNRYESALRTIRGPDDRGPWIEVYREAGGGYGGLQAIAEVALSSAECSWCQGTGKSEYPDQILHCPYCGGSGGEAHAKSEDRDG